MQQKRRQLIGLGAGLGLLLAMRAAQAARPAPSPNTLSIAYNDDYAPYSYLENDQVLGILPDLLEPLLAGLPELRIERLGLPWRRVQQEVSQGLADALCTFASEERQRYTVFHKIPVVSLQPHLFFAANSPQRKLIEQITRREELMPLRLVDQNGNQWAEQNLKDFPNLTYVSGHDGVFRSIMVGRGDVHVSLSPVVTRWRIKKLGIAHDQIVSVPAPFIAADVPFHLLVRKTHPRAAEILAHLDLALKKPGFKKLQEDVLRRYV